MTSITRSSPDSEHDIHLLPAYVNGTLPPAESHRVWVHVRRCPTCRARFDAWAAIGSATRAAFPRTTGTDAGALEAVRAALARPASAPPSAEMGDQQALGQAVAADIPVPPAAYDVRESTDDRVLDIGPGAHPAPTHRLPATGERSEEQ